MGERKHKKNDAVSKAMFVDKYNDTVFDIPDAYNNTFCIGKNEIAWVQGRDGGWTISGFCDVEGVEDEQLSLFLTISLIWLKQHKEGILVEEEKMWGSDNYDNN